MPGARRGTGGHGRRKLEGKGPTPRAEMRPGHAAKRRAGRAERDTAARTERDGPGRSTGGPARPRRSGGEADEELVIGRNPVIEALRARVPGTALLRAIGTQNDPKTIEAGKPPRRRRGRHPDRPPPRP